MPLRLGKDPAVTDSRTLQFARYLRPALPPPPSSVDYGKAVSVWPMYDNDKWGDCTCAAAGHMIQNWTANAGAPVTPPDSDVVSFYQHFVGNPPPSDAGCNMLSVLKYWRTFGLGGHKIQAFASIEIKNQTEAQEAVYLFGSIYIGVELPDFCVTGNVLEVPWVVPPGGPVGSNAPKPNNGHCVPAVAYDSTNLYIVTWGMLKPMTWEFYEAYADESFAVASQDFIGRTGHAPSGFDTAQLKADLKDVTRMPASQATVTRRRPVAR
jgi:hypothetical protein